MKKTLTINGHTDHIDNGLTQAQEDFLMKVIKGMDVKLMDMNQDELKGFRICFKSVKKALGVVKP